MHTHTKWVLCFIRDILKENWVFAIVNFVHSGENTICSSAICATAFTQAEKEADVLTIVAGPSVHTIQWESK